MLPRPTIEAFDAWLTRRSLTFEAIVVGGSARALLGVTNRQTRDFDILHPELRQPLESSLNERLAGLALGDQHCQVVQILGTSHDFDPVDVQEDECRG